MSSSSPSMSAMEMEESSDTSREDRNTKSRHHRPASVHQHKIRQVGPVGRNFAHPPPVSTSTPCPIIDAPISILFLTNSKCS